MEIGDFAILAGKFNTQLPPAFARAGLAAGGLPAKPHEEEGVKLGRLFDELLA